MPFYGGLDWGVAAHAVCVIDERGKVVVRIDVGHDAAGLDAMSERQADAAMTRPRRSPARDVPVGHEDRDAAQYRAPAVEKALDVIEYMAAAEAGRTQTEIAAGVGRSLHEVYRVIQLLERRGYIARPVPGDPLRADARASSG